MYHTYRLYCITLIVPKYVSFQLSAKNCLFKTLSNIYVLTIVWILFIRGRYCDVELLTILPSPCWRQCSATISKVLSRGPAWTRNYEKFTSTKCTNYREKHYNISLCGAKLKPRIKFRLSLYQVKWLLDGVQRMEEGTLYPLLVKLSTNFQVCFKLELIFIILISIRQ